jgi:hypothetical protein
MQEKIKHSKGFDIMSKKGGSTEGGSTLKVPISAPNCSDKRLGSFLLAGLWEGEEPV